MDTSVFDIQPESDPVAWSLIYSTHQKALQANEIITANMELPIDSETVQWDNVDEILFGQYAGMYMISKPQDSESDLLDGVTIEIEAEFDPAWFNDDIE